MTEADILRGLTVGSSKEVLKANPASPLAMLLTEKAQEITDRLRKQMEKYKVDSSGNLKASTNPSAVKVDGGVISIEIESDFYWKFINFGVNGTKVNNGAPSWGRQASSGGSFQQYISKWIRDNGITPRNGMSYDSLNYVIRRSIIEKGKKKRPFFSDVVNTALKRELKDSINKLIKGSIEIIIIEPWQ